MLDIAFESVEKYYGANQVLKGLTFDVNQGEVVGLLGKNGAGKTTLFRILAGRESVDAGRTMIRKGAVVGLLDQIPDFPASYTAHDVLDSAFADLWSILREMAELEEMMATNASDVALRRYGELQQNYESRGGYGIQDAISRVCNGLKIDDTMAKKRFYVLSGGEQTRVMLGKLILEDPDVLLLDEPTNHLDLQSIEWLEEYLKVYKGTSIIISHDRYFLDKVVDRIVEIVDGKAELYAGNYSYFVREKQARYESQLERYERQQKEIKRLEEAAKRMHDWAQRADNESMHKRAFNIEKRIERIEKIDKPKKEQTISTRFSEKDSGSKDVIDIQGLSKRYGQKVVLDGLNMQVQRDDRVAILGANGSGKSTLLNIIAGEEEPDTGVVKIGPSIRFAYLPQIVNYAEPQRSVLETVMQTLGLPEGMARNLLAKYKFPKDNVFKTVGILSGGEKSRLQLCLMMENDVSMLLLDEPTNHLDIDSREWLESALEDFGGVLVFVSHDRYFINKFGNRVVELVNGRIREYGGNYEYYKERKALELQTSSDPVKAPMKKQQHGKQVSETASRSKRKQDELETRIHELEGTIKDINRELEELADDYEALQKLYEERVSIEGELERLYDEWADLWS
ncbi:MAG TPA: ABC-F type ribosomal protection protein [Firmicutes bacterium]|nr:ABC-F type ribosomal protection protein [Bacillota bacterium]